MKSLLNLLILAAVGFLAFLIVFSLYTFYISVRPERIFSNITPDQFNIPFERVYFSSGDETILAGWFIPKEGKKTDSVLIMAHGYPADKGDIFPAFYELRKKTNLFFFDFRYHGESGGSYTAIGAKEVDDLLSAVDYMKRMGMKKIGVFGFSMGGAVALMAQNQTEDIDLIITDSSYARLDLMAEVLYGQLRFLSKPLIFLTDIWSRLVIGTSLKAVSPMDKARGSTIPVLQIHSRYDPVIPFAQALMLQESLQTNPNAEFYFREALNHGMMDPEYQEKIRDFLDRKF